MNFIPNIRNIQKIAFVKKVEKAYTEGVYADTPANRKLGRVGMSYKTTKKEKEKNYKFDIYQLDLALGNNIRFNYFNKDYDFEFSLFKDIKNKEDLINKVEAIIKEYRNSTIHNLDFIQLSSYIEEEAKKLMNKTDYPLDPSKTRKTINIYEGGQVKIGLVFESKEFIVIDEESGEEIPYSYKISIQRTFKKLEGELICYHDEFDMSQVYQKKGFSKIILKKLFDEYQKMGVDEVRLCANMEIGGYCWGRYGFMTHMDQLHPIIEEAMYFDKISKLEKEELTQYILERYKNKKGKGNVFPMNLLAELPYGFRLLKDSTWQGFMDLHDKEQMSIFYDYLNFKE